MKHLSFALFLVIGLCLIQSISTIAQSSDSLIHRANIVKLNLSCPYFYPNSYMVTYERVFRKNQSLGFTIGYMEFPVLFSGNHHFQTDRISHAGFILGGEYRFYLEQENRHPTPHGVFLGPYVSYYSFRNNYNITSDYNGVMAQGSMKSDISFLNIGFQLGYQFVIKNRLTVDFIFFGPSITNYSLDLNLNSNFTLDESNEVVQGVIQAFPLLDKMLKPESVSVHGKTSVWAIGDRFCLQVGYKFGKKSIRN